MVQEQVFLAEIKSLQSKGVVSPNSKLRNLNPFIDSDGLLRVGGRLSNSDLPYVNKHPVILPENHNLTVQIIVHFHRKNLHTGASSLLHYLMGNLPRDRVVPDYPFNCSGVDFLWPIHDQIFSRRGKCAKLYSDNGKTFVGANKELKRFLKLIEDSDDNLAGFLSAEGIEWKFIPPRAPSFGGLWEASALYVDDFLSGYVSVQAALTTCIESKQILEDASMDLRKWRTNSSELNQRLKNLNFEVDEHKESLNTLIASKVLGLGWNEKSDTFYFDSRDLGTFLSKRINTKRYLLQAAGRLFDPVGFIGPYTIQIKCLIQETWCLGLDWDDKLPKQLEVS
ncbi:integrase catalytic domain-containing protein [Trichonephila clavipes]|nr:integrase catalytic domain-containing protein [Trichonephila clavipes]